MWWQLGQGWLRDLACMPRNCPFLLAHGRSWRPCNSTDVPQGISEKPGLNLRTKPRGPPVDAKAKPCGRCGHHQGWACCSLVCIVPFHSALLRCLCSSCLWLAHTIPLEGLLSHDCKEGRWQLCSLLTVWPSVIPED